MAKKDKLLKKARNSSTNWNFQQLSRLLKAWGFVIIPGRGSHFKAVHEETGVTTGLVKHTKDLSKYFVENAVAAIDEVIAKMGETHEEIR
ncbi:MAG: type II toxin-antitoxin system HicA family toxin [Chloroflexi bacterium]|nr:type II toxin-antitoxin system HicA family toxin [Anaerolineaceae bacterium]MCY4107158.1 type II toxin-antitoxin system HicA family toxin [Chloroflexota bacterium]